MPPSSKRAPIRRLGVVTTTAPLLSEGHATEPATIATSADESGKGIEAGQLSCRSTQEKKDLGDDLFGEGDL